MSFNKKNPLNTTEFDAVDIITSMHKSGPFNS